MSSIEKMIPLQTQEQFETILKDNLTKPCVFYFTAKWCSACQRINWDDILADIIPCDLYICDIDTNIYTPGYCGVRRMPSFLSLSTDKKFSPIFQSSDTNAIKEWFSKVTLPTTYIVTPIPPNTPIPPPLNHVGSNIDSSIGIIQ